LYLFKSDCSVRCCFGSSAAVGFSASRDFFNSCASCDCGGGGGGGGDDVVSNSC